MGIILVLAGLGGFGLNLLSKESNKIDKLLCFIAGGDVLFWGVYGVILTPIPYGLTFLFIRGFVASQKT